MQVQQELSKDLIRRCQTGDRSAFSELVGQLMRPAYFQALALLGNEDDAREVSQETFARVWRSIGQYDAAQPFYPWFYTVLRNLAMNALRSRRRHPQVGGDAVDAWLETAAGQADREPEQELRRQQKVARVNAALMQLSVSDREIISLKDMHDYAYKDIACLLGIPIGTVMSRLYTARSRLRSLLEEDGDEQP